MKTIAAILAALIGGAVIYFLGAPTWAVVMFGWLLADGVIFYRCVRKLP